jgi:hypothetical protein
MSGDSIGHVLRSAHNKLATESFNRFFRRPRDNDEPGETSKAVDLDAGVRSSPPPQPIDGNAILRNAIEESIGDRQMRRRWG